MPALVSYQDIKQQASSLMTTISNGSTAEKVVDAMLSKRSLFQKIVDLFYPVDYGKFVAAMFKVVKPDDVCMFQNGMLELLDSVKPAERELFIKELRLDVFDEVVPTKNEGQRDLKRSTVTVSLYGSPIATIPFEKKLELHDSVFVPVETSYTYRKKSWAFRPELQIGCTLTQSGTPKRMFKYFDDLRTDSGAMAGVEKNTDDLLKNFNDNQDEFTSEVAYDVQRNALPLTCGDKDVITLEGYVARFKTILGEGSIEIRDGQVQCLLAPEKITEFLKRSDALIEDKAFLLIVTMQCFKTPMSGFKSTFFSFTNGLCQPAESEVYNCKIVSSDAKSVKIEVSCSMDFAEFNYRGECVDKNEIFAHQDVVGEYTVTFDDENRLEKISFKYKKFVVDLKSNSVASVRALNASGIVSGFLGDPQDTEYDPELKEVMCQLEHLKVDSAIMEMYS